MHWLKTSLKRAGKLARKGARAALPVLKASAPIAIGIAVTVMPAARAVHITHAIAQAKHHTK